MKLEEAQRLTPGRRVTVAGSTTRGHESKSYTGRVIDVGKEVHHSCARGNYVWVWVQADPAHRATRPDLRSFEGIKTVSSLHLS